MLYQLSKRSIPFLREAIRLKQLEKIHDAGGQFAILSPYRQINPDVPTNATDKEKQMSLSKNKLRYDTFLKYIENAGYKYNQSYGRWFDPEAKREDGQLGKWTIEKSMLIKGIPFEEAKQLAAKYHQRAFIHKASNGPVVYYDLIDNYALPTEKITAMPEPSEQKKGPPDPLRPAFREPDLTQPKKGDKNDPPRTVFRNVHLLYDFDFERKRFKVEDGPITWATIQARADEFAKSLATQQEKPESKYRSRHPEE